ncbi:YkgJ family cysteine cluster protein [Lysobacter sp. A03]|uniref:YkgJ family cysteine cluster protein n=1 Tax=Lysobacter sp. A03 TaxID=1199154 RepID=UPI000A00B024
MKAGNRGIAAVGIDRSISCQRCDAVCCRQTVLVMPEALSVPRHMITRTPQGLSVMAQDEDGWCVAVDPTRMNCTIYPQRPGVCRAFQMGSRDCRDVREAYSHLYDEGEQPPE